MPFSGNIKHTVTIAICYIIWMYQFCCAYGQQVQFTNSIAPVIYKNCTPCHRQGAVGPFALEGYDDVRQHAKMITYVVSEHIMPPWRADISYRSFHNERKVDTGFITFFQKWMSEGYPEGHVSSKAGIKQIREAEEKPDYIIRMPKPYKLEAQNTDIFISFMDSIFLSEDRYIRGITVIPGNLKIVHHCRVDIDTTDRAVKLLNKDGFLATADLAPLGPMPYTFVGDYVPGIAPYKYPDNIGFKVTKKLYVLANVHYAPSARQEYDSTKVYIYLYPKGYKPREVKHWIVLLNSADPSVHIPKIPGDSVGTYVIWSFPLDTAISIIAIQPHMHLIGKSMQVFAVKPNNDTIPLIRINDWKFRWQENYYYEKPVVLPKGAVIFARASFDNTVENPDNPFYPPQDIFFNTHMKTTNEMFEVYIQSVVYRPGDEKLDLYK
jgi:Copper type II ascorbate-dependent monooxygenase, C-terminal domain